MRRAREFLKLSYNGGLLIYAVVLILGMGMLNAQEGSEPVPPAIKQQLDAVGLTVEQARQEAVRLGVDLTDPQAVARQARELGVPESSIQKSLDSYPQETKNNQQLEPEESFLEPDLEDEAEYEEEPVEEVPDDKTNLTHGGLPHFGYQLFRDIPTAFKPNETGPVDEGYLIGPGDQLRLIVWGATEFQYEFTVDREGRILVPRVGQWTIANNSLGTARKELKTWLSRKYQGLATDPPTMFMDLTVTRLRPIRIFVLGEVDRPGGYSISSSSTVFNVLYSVGGPLTRGSLRNIQLIRNGRVVDTIDLYNYLLKGYERGGKGLQNNDNIFIPLRGKTVSIEGRVNRSGIFELKGNEDIEDLIEFAGGLDPTAYTRRYRIQRIIPFEERKEPSYARTIIDGSLEDVLNGKVSTQLQDGDHIMIFSILDDLKNSVSITGAVTQPGTYELTKGIKTVADLVDHADGLTGNAYLEQAELYRTNADGSQRLITLNLKKALERDPTDNIKLLMNDRLRIFSLSQLEERNFVSISGKVRTPGSFALMDSMTVYDLLFRGGGLADPEFLRDVYLARADLLRREPDGVERRRIPFNLKAALEGDPEGKMLLLPGDIIRIYPIDVQVFRDKTVSIRGAVKTPGSYNWSREMNLTDLILAAGGFKENAFLKTIEISRPLLSGRETIGEPNFEQIMFPLSELDDPAKLNFALGAGDEDIYRASGFELKPQDIVFVRSKFDQEGAQLVTISGAVAFPGQYTVLYDGEKLSEVIARAGGLTDLAYPRAGRFFRFDRRVIADLEGAIKGKSKNELIVMAGDRIEIPTKPNTILVKGNVQLSGYIKTTRGMRVKSYIKMAGGIKKNTEKILLTLPTGETIEIKRFLGVQCRNPKVEDGSEIIVIREPDEDLNKQNVDISKVMMDSMAFVSSVLTIVLLISKI